MRTPLSRPGGHSGDRGGLRKDGGGARRPHARAYVTSVIAPAMTNVAAHKPSVVSQALPSIRVDPRRAQARHEKVAPLDVGVGRPRP